MSERQTPFRKESLERISSPEQLDDYIRVQKPTVWIVLILALVLLAAFFVWAGIAKLDGRALMTYIFN